MTDKHYIVGVHITDRVQRVPDVQKVFTEFGCNIKTRIGLHHVTDDLCSPNGLILLELHGDDALCEQLVAKVSAVAGVQVQKMVFDHPAA